MSRGFRNWEDLTAELAEYGRGFVRALVRVVWIYLYQARIQEAIDLLDSDGLQRIAESSGSGARTSMRLECGLRTR